MQDNIVIEVKLSAPQETVLNTRKRLVLDMAGQGAGKTGIIGLGSGEMISRFPKANGFIAANTKEQLSGSTMKGTFKEWERVYGWTEYDKISNPAGEYILNKIPPIHFKRPTKLTDYRNTISFRNGTVVFIGSLENYKAHDGKEFTWAHLDETKDTEEKAITDVILGRLRQIGLWFDQEGELHWEESIDKAMARGWTAWNPLYIHSSPAVGVEDWLKEMFELTDEYEDEIKEEVYKREYGFYHREFREKCVVIYSSFHNKANLPPNFLENQLATLKPSLADKLVFGLPFSKSGGEYYPSFEKRDIVKKVSRIPGIPVHLTFDFNSRPYCTLVCNQLQYMTMYEDLNHKKSDLWQPGYMPIEVIQIRVYAEYCATDGRVETCCRMFDEDHRDDMPDVYYYGDSSGLSRIPGLGSLTNFKVIEDYLQDYIHNLSKKVKHPNVSPAKRRDLVDDIFSGKYPEIEIVIDEDCILTIKDFEKLKKGKDGLKFKKKAVDPETKQSWEEIGHTSDAVECFISEAFKEYIKKR